MSRTVLALVLIAMAAPAWANMGSGCFATTKHKISEIPAGATVKIADSSLKFANGGYTIVGETIQLSGLGFWNDEVHKIRKHRVYRDSLTVFECAG